MNSEHHSHIHVPQNVPVNLPAAATPQPALDKHFVATTYILHPVERKVLMMWHRKLNSWLPPGGHLNANETPDEGARREVLEETGLQVDFYPQANWKKLDERAVQLPSPHHTQMEKIGEGHYHIDFIFFAKAKSAEPKTEEGHELKWFSEAEVKNLPQETIFDNTRQWALHALHEIK